MQCGASLGETSGTAAIPMQVADDQFEEPGMPPVDSELAQQGARPSWMRYRTHLDVAMWVRLLLTLLGLGYWIWDSFGRHDWLFLVVILAMSPSLLTVNGPTQLLKVGETIIGPAAGILAVAEIVHAPDSWAIGLVAAGVVIWGAFALLVFSETASSPFWSWVDRRKSKPPL